MRSPPAVPPHAAPPDLQAGVPTTDALLDQAGRLLMFAPQQAQALAEQAWAALPEAPAGGASAPHARVQRTLGLALHC